MQQINVVNVGDLAHSKVHEQNMPHEHKGNDIVLTLDFEEKYAMGMIPLCVNTHTYDLAHVIYVPAKDENGEYRHSTIQYSDGSINRDPIKIHEETYNVLTLMRNKANRELQFELNISDSLKEIRSRFDEWDEAKAFAAKLEEERKVLYEEYKLIEAEKERANKLRDEEIKARNDREKVEREEAKRVWIEANGSERLKLGFARGHNCEKLYTLELCDSLPAAFVLDYEGDVSTKARSCPSLEALKLVEELEKANLPFVSDISIVWLPKGLDELDPDCCEEPHGKEAIELKVNGHYGYHLVD